MSPIHSKTSVVVVSRPTLSPLIYSSSLPLPFFKLPDVVLWRIPTHFGHNISSLHPKSHINPSS
ncbi:hypothetical protein Fmac_005452 [Flemingia macrophylla]|uniref:Uncharacterized protein n=1 Tax=Flemingia macrophylla TaxID=520843 RepID=A0ABD1N7T6_9FABA